MSRCTAKSKRSGDQCKRHASPGYSVCAIHGGKTPRGMALPQTKHGRYSKDLPTRLVEQYETAIADPDLLNLSDEISLVETRIRELQQRIDVDGGGQLWGAVAGIAFDLKSAQADEDMDAIKAITQRLMALAQRATDDAKAWDAIISLIEQRRKLIESEAKRRVQMQDTITSERAMLLITQLVDAVARHVHDRTALAAISNEFRALVA